MLAVIVIEAGFMQRGAIIDDQQVALFILVRKQNCGCVILSVKSCRKSWVSSGDMPVTVSVLAL